MRRRDRLARRIAALAGTGLPGRAMGAAENGLVAPLLAEVLRFATHVEG